MGVRAVTQQLLDAAFPANCPGCGREGLPICSDCLPALDARVALPGGTLIGLPSEIPRPLLQLEWCAPFTGVARRALHQLKYAGEERLAGPLGSAMARRWKSVGIGAQLVCHVPVHRDRERQRGYDQAELLARVVSTTLGLPHVGLLERGRATEAQFELGRSDRAANVRGAFEPAAIAKTREMIADRWVLLADDVVTTGATLAACAEVLLDAGALGISAVTVARER